MRLCTLLTAVALVASATAHAAVTYTYAYDLSDSSPGLAGSFSFTTPGFITNSTFFPSINHVDPVGDALSVVNFRNIFQPVDGSPLGPTPALDVILQSGNGFDAVVGGPLNQVGTLSPFDFGPHDRLSLTIALVPIGVEYDYTYDLSDVSPGLAGSFSLTAPVFLDQSRSFAPFQHTDPAGDQLAYVDFRNIFQPLDGSLLGPTPAIDVVLASGNGFDAVVGGPLDQDGTYSPFDFGPHDFLSLTVSGAPDPVPEPSSAAMVLGGLTLLIGVRRNPRAARR